MPPLQDTLLRAAQELQGNRAPGFLAGSLPLSKAAALQREQRTLKAASDYVSWDLDDDGDDEDDAELDDGTDYDADGADDDGSLQQQQQRLLGGPRRLGGGSSNVQRLSGRSGSSGSSGWALVGSQQRGYRHQRRAPDLLEFVECTKPAGSDSSSAGGGSGGGLASMTSRAAALAAGGDGGAKGLPLNLPLDRYGRGLSTLRVDRHWTKHAPGKQKHIAGTCSLYVQAVLLLTLQQLGRGCMLLEQWLFKNRVEPTYFKQPSRLKYDGAIRALLNMFVLSATTPNTPTPPPQVECAGVP